MSETIETTKGQDARGRFKPGNKLGKGNPLAGRAARIRAALLKAVSPADAKAIAHQLIAQAKGGDIAAAREVFDRCLGKPGVALDVTIHPEPEQSPLQQLISSNETVRAAALELAEKAIEAGLASDGKP